jgi:hypothetical protein
MSDNNHFFFIRTVWGALCQIDWREAMTRGGILAVITEFFRALTGMSAWPFFVPADRGWQPSSIRPILHTYGIPTWGWGRQGGEFFFQVKLRQANWAQYLLQQHGVPLSGQLLDEGRRSAYRPVSQRVSRATPGATHVQPSTVTAAVTPVAKPEATTSLFSDPVGQINKTVDRLAKW